MSRKTKSLSGVCVGPPNYQPPPNSRRAGAKKPAMKARQSSTEQLIRLRTWKVESSSTDTLKPYLDEVFSPSMSFPGINGFQLDPASPTRPNGDPFGTSSTALKPAVTERTTPTKLSKSTSATQDSSARLKELEFANLDSQRFSSPPGTPCEVSDGWSAAVGRATVGGKSGRVIEKLQGDNDRLRRESKLANAKLEEEVRRGESATLGLESLRTTNENLMAICEANTTAITRRDRKIEELRADLQAERNRREFAETQTRDIGRERDEAISNFQTELFSEKEMAKRASSQYDILSSSWRGLDEGYRVQTQRLKADIVTLQNEHERNLARFEKLEKFILQLNSDHEKTKSAHEQVIEEYEGYKQENDRIVGEMASRAARNDIANHEALEALYRVLGEMKHVMAVKRDVKEVDVEDEIRQGHINQRVE